MSCIVKEKFMSENKTCIVCNASSTEIPVTKFYYQESNFYICPQHIPILIHNPQELIGMLPGAEKLKKG
ncbi:hypothetical protein SAMN05444411_101576 [Lutibacter oricola]|uniref:Uncharacterized protein n=1 Tax=Lutibacter oricola TaxID=762486 RepID=A0A1H2SZC3_9FLAO|nr:hypothetical protein SAMN05444411_101576 [Lutibacter oricola]